MAARRRSLGTDPAEPRAPRKRLPPERRREEILDAARAAFRETGVHGTTMGDIADRAGITQTHLYRHFNKENIKPRYAFGHGLSYTSFSFSSASISAVTPLTSVPPTRPAKGATPAYSTAIPPASEAYWPENFNRIWRYLYSWLEKNDADDAAKAANSTTKYPYPAGYSNVQKAGPAAGGAQVRMFMRKRTCDGR